MSSKLPNIGDTLIAPGGREYVVLRFEPRRIIVDHPDRVGLTFFDLDDFVNETWDIKVVTPITDLIDLYYEQRNV